MNSPIEITIADRIKNYRKEHNLSLHGFGMLLGVSGQAVHKWENELCYPDIIFLPQLAEILNCSTDDFFK